MFKALSLFYSRLHTQTPHRRSFGQKTKTYPWIHWASRGIVFPLPRRPTTTKQFSTHNNSFPNKIFIKNKTSMWYTIFIYFLPSPSLTPPAPSTPMDKRGKRIFRNRKREEKKVYYEKMVCNRQGKRGIQQFGSLYSPMENPENFGVLYNFVHFSFDKFYFTFSTHFFDIFPNKSFDLLLLSMPFPSNIYNSSKEILVLCFHVFPLLLVVTLILFQLCVYSVPMLAGWLLSCRIYVWGSICSGIFVLNENQSFESLNSKPIEIF